MFGIRMRCTRLLCIRIGSSAQEETPTQPPQGEQDENESTTSSGMYSYIENSMVTNRHRICTGNSNASAPRKLPGILVPVCTCMYTNSP